MPSTDIDGSPILILNQEQVQKILEMSKHVDTLTEPMRKLIEKIDQTFVGEPKIGERELVIVTSLRHARYDIGVVSNRLGTSIFRLLCRVTAAQLTNDIRQEIGAIQRLGARTKSYQLWWPLGTVVVGSALNLPDSEEIRARIEKINSMLSSA